MDIHVVGSLTQANTYFIFRETGAEVTVRIVDRTMFSSHKMLSGEKDFIIENIIKDK